MGEKAGSKPTLTGLTLEVYLDLKSTMRELKRLERAIDKAKQLTGVTLQNQARHRLLGEINSLTIELQSLKRKLEEERPQMTKRR